ncbi:hypothetical protein DBR11_21455 [Pedobacter sp. HMWF019]|uniref:hypothetical protein n=1 Tax=Pedobacter sp. HMWF019 TaxID=2056856 RepID=UPI000D34B42C|nr:hypothetical protein [Pedobacter sp. HMWF019]PTS95409.1 hypothetical protein DBR11_21455 [Pedobacter sp. HMWF019]
MRRLLFGLAFLSLSSLGFAQKKTDYTIVRSLVKEAKEKGNMKLMDSLAQSYISNYLFKLKKEELYTKENLNFMGDFLSSEDSKAFKVFKNEPEKVNAVLGVYQAQNKIMDFINKKYLPQGDFKKMDRPDWDALEKMVSAKFGALGQEIVWGQRMVYHWILKDNWSSFAKYYVLYFQRGLKHPRYHINNISWYGVFEHVNDPKVLEFSTQVMQYALENYNQNDAACYDTYANLLYKAGHKEKAIEWEERAVKLSNNDKSIVETLEKMRNNLPTWPVVTNNL